MNTLLTEMGEKALLASPGILYVREPAPVPRVAQTA